MVGGKRWAVLDRDGNTVYLTEERWEHIVDALGHPEMAECEEHVKWTIQKGRRRQDALNPRKYRYAHAFNDLPGENNHIVAIVLFGFSVGADGLTVPNNFVATAFAKHIRPKGS